MGAQSGPPTHEVATADLVGWNTVMHLKPPGHPKGGSGMLSEALQRRLESYGGRVRLGDGAAAITTVAAAASPACAPTRGEHLPADVVVAGCHVLTTVDLLGDGAPGDLADAGAPHASAPATASAWSCGSATTALPRYAARHRRDAPLDAAASRRAGRPCAGRTASTAPGCRRPSPPRSR